MTTHPLGAMTPTHAAEDLLERSTRSQHQTADGTGLPTIPVFGHWDGAVDPAAHLGSTPDLELLAALHQGSSVAQLYMGTSHCRTCGRTGLGSADLTNGWCVYPSGLAHYVAEHALVLPPEVRELMLAPARPLPTGPRAAWLLREHCADPGHTGACFAQHLSLETWRATMAR